MSRPEGDLSRPPDTGNGSVVTNPTPPRSTQNIAPRSYSAVVNPTGAPGISYATAASATAKMPGLPKGPLPAMVNRERAVVLMNNEIEVSKRDLALALTKALGTEQAGRLLIETLPSGHILVQLTHPDDNVSILSGLKVPIRDTSFGFQPLQVRLKESYYHLELIGIDAGPNGRLYVDQLFLDYGEVVSCNFNKILGTPIFDGTCSVILDLFSHVESLPPCKMQMANGSDQHLDVTIRVDPSERVCFYCHSTSHRRNKCNVAPKCRGCGSQAHSGLRCPTLSKQKDFEAARHRQQVGHPVPGDITILERGETQRQRKRARVSDGPTGATDAPLVNLPSSQAKTMGRITRDSQQVAASLIPTKETAPNLLFGSTDRNPFGVLDVSAGEPDEDEDTIRGEDDDDDMDVATSLLPSQASGGNKVIRLNISS